MTARGAEEQAATPRDRRAFQRVQVLLLVEYQDPQELMNDYITNLGDGGIFIHTSLPFKEGQRLSFSLSFPGLLEPIDLKGLVRWRCTPNFDSPEQPVGLGVEFVFEGAAQRQAILDLLESLEGGARAIAAASARPFRVLMVEDNLFVQELFSHALRRFHSEQISSGSLEILHTEDGAAALRTLGAQPIDLAIVDHYLPGMTGCELIKEIRGGRQLQDLPILVVSVGGEEIKREAQVSGADLYLEKPVMHKQLVSTLARLLSRGAHEA